MMWAGVTVLLVTAVSAWTCPGSCVTRSLVISKAPMHLTNQRPAASAVHMNLADRFVRLAKANINELLAKGEDPEKMLNQAVQDMQGDLVKVRQAYAEVSASQKRMTEQARVANAEADRWYQRAQMALEKGEEELAREALSRKQQQTEMADSLQAQIDAQAANIDALFQSMKELEAKMAEAKAKKDQYVARARTAKATTKVNDMLSSVGKSSSMQAFDRMKDKVDSMEAEAEVSREMAITSGGSGGSLESKFKELEAGGGVEDELAKMKRALGSGAKGAIGATSEIDDELAKMKKKIDDAA